MNNLFTLRKADLNDCQILLDWRNDDKIRKWCGDQSMIELSDHQKWFEKALLDDSVVIYMASDDSGQLIGTVRFNQIDLSSAMISINLSPEKIGAGYGSRLIEYASKYYLKQYPKVNEIQAEIMKVNEVSIRAFEKSGYVYCEVLLKNSIEFEKYIFSR